MSIFRDQGKHGFAATMTPNATSTHIRDIHCSPPPVADRTGYVGLATDVTATDLARQNLGMSRDIADVCAVPSRPTGGSPAAGCDESGGAAEAEPCAEGQSPATPTPQRIGDVPPPVTTAKTFGEDLAMKYLHRPPPGASASGPQDIVMSNPKVRPPAWRRRPHSPGIVTRPCNTVYSFVPPLTVFRPRPQTPPPAIPCSWSSLLADVKV